MRQTLRTIGIAAALIVTAYLGSLIGGIGKTEAYTAAAESAANARYAMLHATTAVQAAADLKRERDSLLQHANTAGSQRVTKTTSAINRLAALGAEPTVKPDTCKEWIERAQKATAAAQDAVEATTFAQIEVGDLRAGLANADASIARLKESLAVVTPVLKEHTGVRLPGSTGFHLASLLPRLSAGYGVMLSPEGGGFKLHQGPVASIGYTISLGKVL